MSITGKKLINVLLVAVVAAELSVVVYLAAAAGVQVSRPGLVSDRETPEEAGKTLLSLPQDQIALLAEREKIRLSSEPLDLQALSNLSLLASLAGHKVAAQELSQEAANRSLRDPFTQLSAAETQLQNTNYARAFYHVDALLSSQPGLDDKIFPMLGSLLDNVGAVPELAKTLAAEPRWRTSFTTWLAGNDSMGQRAFALFNAIRSAQGGVKPEEMRALIENQIKQKNYDKAYFYWLDSLGPAELAKAGNLFDGQFTFEPNNQYFDWNIVPAQNVDVSIVPVNKENVGRELRLSFINNTAIYGHVFQYLHLRPGQYEMSGKWASSTLTTSGGLRWTTACLESSQAIGNSQTFATASPDEAFRFAINVPEIGCDFQVLRLVTASSAVLDAKINGDIRFQQLQIEEAN